MIDCSDELTTTVLDAAFEVHRELGPGLLESVYEAALAIACAERGLSCSRQVPVKAEFRGHDLGVGFRADLIVEKSLLLEIKVVDSVLPVHIAQAMTYMKLLGFKRGYVLNFNEKLLKNGIRRISI